MNLFMICRQPRQEQMRALPAGFSVRLLRPDELPLWEAFPFDDQVQAAAHRGDMQRYFQDVYAARSALFFSRCLVVADRQDEPVATCFLWPAYEGAIHTLHWLKVRRDHEGLGIGRGLLSHLLAPLTADDLPLYLHTQPESYRAIKLYSDLGFDLIENEQIGWRSNDLAASLPYLRQHMPLVDFQGLRYTHAPETLLRAARSSHINQF